MNVKLLSNKSLISKFKFHNNYNKHIVNVKIPIRNMDNEFNNDVVISNIDKNFEIQFNNGKIKS